MVQVMHNRGFNFGAGPAMLPESILQEAQEALLNWRETGMSVLEVGHRTDIFRALLDEAEADLRQLLNVPQNYRILFLGGAARLQFDAIPINFLSEKEEGGYLVTGIWSDLAYQEANKLKQAYCIANASDNGFTNIPSQSYWHLRDQTKYFFYTPNETINGIRFPKLPPTNGIPLVADMTSCLLTEPLNVNDYALIFAGAQKNIANAGLTLVIISDEFMELIGDKIPTMLDYRTHSRARSTYATPPTFNCYLAAKMFQWLKKLGGVEAMGKLNHQKAKTLYDYIDKSDVYLTKVVKEMRSLVNVCFSLAVPSQEKRFLQEAESQGLLSLKGHAKVGGLRASLYNAMPLEGVDRLVCFMKEFAKSL